MKLNYGSIMKEIRTFDLITQATVAEKLGISISGYQQFESQKKIIPLARLNMFCNYFNVSIDLF